ncbi:SufD family Fe-S cluster assembly protein, partial [Klebsiella pneumoniae]|nr:SufD family Fe-S cluster assembly protein [Klebsiella pneumoniae]
NKNLLLSNTAKVVSVPSLEVLTNSVQCKHGTATSCYNEEQLVYLQSRGIPEQKAKELLLTGFFGIETGLNKDQLEHIMHQLLKN